MDLLKELQEFLQELRQYTKFLSNPDSVGQDEKKSGFYVGFPLITAALSQNLSKTDKDEYIEKFRQLLVRKSGKYKDKVSDLTGKRFYTQFGQTHEIWSDGLQKSGYKPQTITALNYCIDATNEAIGILEVEGETWGIVKGKSEREEPNPNRTSETFPKAFIAHGGDSPALRKLKDFLLSLNVQPLVVEEQASQGRSVGEKVDWYASRASLAIILATKGDIDGKTGDFLPRSNVSFEIGKLQVLFKDKLIYLLQSGAKYPSNVSEKVWTRFSPQSMDRAFISIANELKAFGITK